MYKGQSNMDWPITGTAIIIVYVLIWLSYSFIREEILEAKRELKEELDDIKEKLSRIERITEEIEINTQNDIKG